MITKVYTNSARRVSADGYFICIDLTEYVRVCLDLMESIKTTSMEDVSTRVLEKIKII